MTKRSEDSRNSDENRSCMSSLDTLTFADGVGDAGKTGNKLKERASLFPNLKQL
jgi:hypothetical protein